MPFDGDMGHWEPRRKTPDESPWNWIEFVLKCLSVLLLGTVLAISAFEGWQPLEGAWIMDGIAALFFALAVLWVREIVLEKDLLGFLFSNPRRMRSRRSRRHRRRCS